MNSKRYFLMALPALLLWLLALPVHAAVEAGRILFARGTVAIVDQSDSARGAGVGSVFYEGDRVVTGSNSIAQLRLSDGALTALRSNSNYHIQRQRFDEANDVYEQAGRLVTGWMRSVTGTIGARRPGNVSQGTSVATIGIRGTVYQVIHVPENGLPEFPNLEPGTYIYLEEGQIEISNDAGSRLVSPGQVVRVRGANIAPELAPEFAELFQSETVARSGAGGGEDFDLREITDDISDEVSRTIVDRVDTAAPPPFVRVGGMNVAGYSYFNGASVDEEMMSFGEVDGYRYVDSVILPSFYDYRLTANAGLTPQCLSCRYNVRDSSGNIVSEVFWGKWLIDQYVIEEDLGGGFSPGPSPTENWHYVFGSNLVVGEQVDRFGVPSFDLGLTGTYRYNYVPGSALFSSIDGGNLNLNSGQVTVNFGHNLLKAEMVFSGGMLSGNTTVHGQGYIKDLYDFGIDVTSNDSEDYYFYGSFKGGFVGDGGEGLLTGFNLVYGTEVPLADYFGTAVFQQGNPAVFGYQGLSGLRFGDNADIGRIAPSNMLMFAAQNNVMMPYLVTYIDGAGNVKVVEATAETTSGLEFDYYEILDANESPLVKVIWGVWSSPDFEVTSGGSPVTSSADWHFMISTNPMTLSQVGQLVGSYQYLYVGGTPIAGNMGGELVIDYGAISVNFADMTMDIELAFTSEDFVSGFGSVAGFYGSGIGLSGDFVGTISGEFVGPDAVGIISAIDLETLDGLEQYLGMALFDRQSGQQPPDSPFGGMSIFQEGSFTKVKGYIDPADMYIGGSGGDIFPVDVDFYDSSLGYNYYAYSQFAAEPLGASLGQYEVLDGTGNVTSEVYWGIWDQGTYFAGNDFDTLTPGGGWHYMIATNTLNESQLSSLGLSGSYVYSYAGGTALTEYFDGQTVLLQATSQVEVDFTNFDVQVDLAVIGGGFTNLNGTGTISDLYSTGIFLLDSVDSMGTGRINGAFAGAAAEALLSTIVLDYNTESYYGTALFEQIVP